MMKFFMIFTFLWMITIPYSPCLAEKAIELKPQDIIKERRPSLSGITADFYTKSAYDYWIEKTKLGLPADKKTQENYTFYYSMLAFQKKQILKD